MTGAKISIKQFQILLIFDILGTGLIALPRAAAELAGNDGWLLVIGATVIAIFYALMINLPSEMFPQYTFTEYSQKVMGRPIGIALSILLALRLVVSVGIELRIFGEIISRTMLHKTPQWVTCGVVSAVSAYLICKGYETRARLAEILIIPVLVMLALVFLPATVNADWTNLLPVLKNPSTNLLAGAFYLSFTFRGAELALLVYPLVKEPRCVKKGQMKAVLAIGVVMLAATVLTLMKFGPEDTKAHFWPLLQMTDTHNIPGGFFERMDAFVLSIWIVLIVVSTGVGIFFPAYILGRVFTTRAGYYILPMAATIAAISMLPGSVSQAYNWLMLCDITLGTAFLIFVPFLIFITARLRGMGE